MDGRGTDLRPHRHQPPSAPQLILREEVGGDDDPPEGTPQALEVPPRETASGMSMYHSAASGLPEADEPAQGADAQPAFVQPSLQDLVAVQSQVSRTCVEFKNSER